MTSKEMRIYCYMGEIKIFKMTQHLSESRKRLWQFLKPKKPFKKISSQQNLIEMNLRIFYITLLIHFSICIVFSQTELQTTSNEIEKTAFEIANIEVVGAIHSDQLSVISRSGLKVGKQIDTKGYDIPKAIQNLMKTKLYKEVEIYQVKTTGDLIFLKIQVEEVPVLNKVSIKNIKKREREDLLKVLHKQLLKGTRITETQQNISKNTIQKYFEEKGYLNAEVHWREMPCPHIENCTNVIFEIHKGQKVKIDNITFAGNKVVSEKKLRKLMATKRKIKLFRNPLSLSGKKFFDHEKFETDKKQILAYYRTLGYLDVKVLEEKITPQKNGDLNVHLTIEEGEIYRFGNITWRGNSKYKTEILNEVLGIQKGDVFNEQLLQERIHFNPKGLDISRLYMDNGHLFFKAVPTEKSLHGNEIDIEIQIYEGEQATIGNVKIVGNDITNDAVIRRELRTLPGDKFNREDIIRSQRSLINMGYFNPETVNVVPKPNPQTGTVDIEYQVEETSNDKFEVSGSWGGSDVGLVGTAGVQLNNFSFRKMFQKDGWSPFPRGDGQSLGLRMQYGGKQYQSYNFSFTEPWLNGKPNSLSFGLFYNRYNDDGTTESVFDEHLNILGANINLGKRIKVGEEYIISRTGLNFQLYNLDNWSSGLFQTDDGEVVSNGKFYNFSISQEFTRTTLNHPIFPTSGSRISLNMQFTPPYSLFSEKDPDGSITDRFSLVEYHKWRLDFEQYIPLGKKLTLKLAGRMGFMGNYNRTVGTSPFERFQLGGDAFSNSQLGFTGTDRITMRGYGVEDFETNIQNGQIVATPLFNKFTAELRYPLSLNPSATFYGLAFFEAGNAWSGFSDYNPFDLKRAAGVGFRAHLPMFGTLGVDYGVGFDNHGPRTLSNLARWNFTLGVELD